MLSLQAPATNCVHLCVCFLFVAKVNILEVFNSPFGKEQSLSLYGEGPNYLGPWWSFFPVYCSFPPYSNTCTKQAATVSLESFDYCALKRKTDEHTLGHLALTKLVH